MTRISKLAIDKNRGDTNVTPINQWARPDHVKACLRALRELGQGQGAPVGLANRGMGEPSH